MICVPITAKTTNEALKDVKNAKHADIIELRADFIRDISIKSLESIIKNAKKPLIVTLRKKSEGGKFSGSEEKRIELLGKAAELGADFVDIELSSGTKAVTQLKKASKHTKIIVSHHNFNTTPTNLDVIYRKIKKTGCDIVKIATFARSIEDNIKICKLIKKARKENKKIIALCMGEKGQLSRILSPVFGAFLTFGSLKQGKESAPGQIEAETLKNIYRINNLKNPRIFGLVGNPVSESKGYIIHNKSFSNKNVNAIYVNFLADNVRSFVNRFKGIFQGLSITMPFKEQVIRALDDIDPVTKNIGAVNTVVKKGSKLIGYNTDYIGAIKAIEKRTKLAGKRAVIVGAGGVAKAVAFGLKQKGAQVSITDIDVNKAKSLSHKTNSHYFLPDELGKQEIDILINATPVGMFPKVKRTPVSKNLLKKHMIVFDCIYNPVKTQLLKDAEKKGCRTISGLELFINQAAAQFELWTGKKAPYSLMKKELSK